LFCWSAQNIIMYLHFALFHMTHLKPTFVTQSFISSVRLSQVSWQRLLLHASMLWSDLPKPCLSARPFVCVLRVSQRVFPILHCADTNMCLIYTVHALLYAICMSLPRMEAKRLCND
jgi:hypothetical protein